MQTYIEYLSDNTLINAICLHLYWAIRGNIKQVQTTK